MKKFASSIIGGIAGAIALNVLHQTVRAFDHDAPRVDIVGKEALVKVIKKVGIEPPDGRTLLAATLLADLVSNAAYFSAIGYSSKKYLPISGAITGLTAGVGTLQLTKPMGLNDGPISRTGKKKLMTVAWYTFGGLVAGIVMLAIRNES